MTKPKCLFVGDGCVATGFARMNHAYIDGLLPAWDVAMLALNYDGGPEARAFPYPIYPTSTRMTTDRWGTARLPQLVTQLRPDVVVVVNDPWNIPSYMQRVGETPVVASIAVDGLNCRGLGLNGLKHAIFWTQFGLDQARLGGFTGPASIVPLGVDLSVYHPTEQAESRRRIGMPAQLRGSDTFFVGVVGRNQPRKRIDLAMMAFTQWIRSTRNNDAYLFIHEGPTGDQGWELEQLAAYLGIQNRVIISAPEIGHGIAEENMKYVYSAFDVMITGTTGEGWGLTHMEGMACGVPQILPSWAALAEWANGAAQFVSCPTFACTPTNINVVGGVPDMQEMVDSLELLYRNPNYRDELREIGLERVSRPEFRWQHIGQAFREILDNVLAPPQLLAPQKLEAVK